ncbi:MAG: hypothetical protein JXB34_08850 [Bacteroidales bacterium]|nr:hypothetical protein [Bacteroidales bacterium]
MQKKTFIILFFPLLLCGCVEIEQVSPVPRIEFISFNIENLGGDPLEGGYPWGLLEFRFIDGDADLGVYKEINDSLSLPDSVKSGLFINLFEKVNGAYVERVFTQPRYTKDTIKLDTIIIIRDTIVVDTISYNMHLPYDEKLDRAGQNKTVKGIIRAKILFEKTPPLDTMRFEFYVRDRALNKSNVEYTTDFYFKDKEANGNFGL